MQSSILKGWRTFAPLFVLILFLAPIAAAPVSSPDNGPCEKALREAVVALGKVDPSAEYLPRLWCAVADLRRQLGDRKGAALALQEARNLMKAPRKLPIVEWREIGNAHGRLGDAKVIADLIASIPQSSLQTSALAAAGAGELRAAEQIAAALSTDRAKETLKATIRRLAVIQQAKAGDAVGAIRAADKLPSAADKVFALVGMVPPTLPYDDDTVGPLATAAALAGDRVGGRRDGIAATLLVAGNKVGAKEAVLEALALLPKVEENRLAYPSSALAVVRMLTLLDDLKAARKALTGVRKALTGLAKAAPKGDDRLQFALSLQAAGYIAAAEVRAGRDDAGITLAKDFTRPSEQAYILHWVALAQARAGRKEAAKANFARAVELVDKDPDRKGAPTRSIALDGRGTTRHNIASAQALAGDFAGATRTAEGTSQLTYINLIYAQALAGDFAGARKNTATYVRYDTRIWYTILCRQALARLQARAGQEAAVREWAAKEDDPLVKASILLGLAEGLYREGGKVPGRR